MSTRERLVVYAAFLYAVILGINSVIINGRLEKLEARHVVSCSSQGVAVMMPSGMATSLPICQ